MWQRKSNLKRLHKEFQMNEQGLIGSWGQSVLQHIAKTVGAVLKKPALCLNYKEEVIARVASIDGTVYSMFFSVGLFNLDRVEFVMVLPSTWPIVRYCDKYLKMDSLPADILIELANKVARKNFKSGSIDEGYVIDKTKAGWSKLTWPDDLQGFVVVDVSWSDPDRDYSIGWKPNEIAIYTLVPVYEKLPTTSNALRWAQDRHFAKWDTLLVKEPVGIFAHIEMSQAVDAVDLEKIKNLIQQGQDLNDRYWYFHESFGWVQEETMRYVDKLSDSGVDIKELI